MSEASSAALYAAHFNTLIRRADAALQRGQFNHLLIPSGKLRYQVFDDRDYPYAVNPQFKHWVPIVDAPESWIVYTPGQTPKLIHLQPKDYWHAAPQPASGAWTAHFEIITITDAADALVHFPKDVASCAILGDENSGLGPYVPNNPQAVLDYLDYYRAYKTAYEVQMLYRANVIAARAHTAALRAFNDGASEFGIHMAYCMVAGQDSHALPYNNIVALNQNAAILHYTDRARITPTQVHSFLIDAGASHAGYAADITRTYAKQQQGDFVDLIAAVDTVQQQLCSEVKANVDYRDLHVRAHLLLGEVLHRADIIKVKAEEAVNKGITSAFFPHGLGHGLGLQVHDVGGFAASDAGGRIPRPEGHPYLRLTRRLEEGMVVTIEPGIYFIDMLLEKLDAHGHGSSLNWSRINQFKPFGGIRIEDDVLCQKDTPRNLSREAFVEVGS